MEYGKGHQWETKIRRMTFQPNEGEGWRGMGGIYKELGGRAKEKGEGRKE